MKRYTARQVLTARLIALALVTLCLLQVPVRAQGMTAYIVIFPSVGFVPGQSLRLTVFNPNDAPVGVQARTHHSGGMVVGLGDGSVRFLKAGVSDSFDLRRSDILLPGEDGTGRIQLSVSISCVSQTDSRAMNPIIASLETVDVTDGTSNTFLIGEAIPSAPGGDGGLDVLIGGSTQDTLMGFVPGETLRVTLYNPQSSGTDYPPSRVKLFESGGSVIAQSPDLAIPPGTFRSVDFNREALTLAGEPGTSRLQVRVRVEAADPSSLPTGSGASGLLVASFELIDNITGRTTAHQNNLKQIGLASIGHYESRY
jgi:hypothetical protein